MSFDIQINKILESDTASGEFTPCVETTNHVHASQKASKDCQNLRNIILQAPVAMGIFLGPQYVVEIANDRMLAFWGKQRREVIGKPLFEGVPESKGQGFEQLLSKVYTTGETVKANSIPVALNRKEKGEEVWVNLVYEAYREPDGSISGIMVVANEVTEQVKAIRQIELTEERARLAIHSADLGVYEVNMQTGTVEADARFHEILDTIPSSSWEQVLQSIHPDDRLIREWAVEKAMKIGQLDYQVRIIRKDKSIHWMRALGRVFFDEEGIALRLIGMIQDITEQKRFAEELEIKVAERTKELALINKQLQQSNAELNQFAYVASHDLQEPLRKVRTYSGLLASSLPEVPPKTNDYLQRIENATKRMQNLIHDVLNFSKIAQPAESLEWVDLNDTLKIVLEDYELLIEQTGAIVTVQDLPVVEAAGSQMILLFTNLVSNALKFRNRMYEPEISLASGRLSKEEISRHPGLADDRVYHAITCTDNGIGFEQEYAERIFAIFQRLHGKHEYEGTGIGLAMCKKIVLNHHGLIYATSAPDGGACFTIILPEKQLLTQ